MEPIKQEIVNNIYENGENLITGPVLQEVLLDMVDDTNAKISSSVGDVVTLITEVSESALKPEDLEGYATEQWVEEQGYLKEVPEGYATTESLNQLSESVSASISSIPSVDLSGYATTQSVNEATESVKEWVEAKHYLTTASLSGSVTEESVQFMINDSTASMKEWVESQSYATETFVSESIASLDIPDTSGFVTTQSYNQDSASFDERINAITGSDLSGYATTESLNQLSESVASDSASFDERINSIVVPDLSSYATTESLNQVSESVASNITSLSESIAAITGSDLSGYATTESLNTVSQSLSASIAAITGSSTDLSGYVTTASYNQDSASFDQRIDAISSSIPDMSGYATTESLNQFSESVAQDLEGKADKSDLPDLSTYATTESLNTVSQSLSASIAAITGSDLSVYVTTASYNQDSASFNQRIENIVVSGSGEDTDLRNFLFGLDTNPNILTNLDGEKAHIYQAVVNDYTLNWIEEPEQGKTYFIRLKNNNDSSAGQEVHITIPDTVGNSLTSVVDGQEGSGSLSIPRGKYAVISYTRILDKVFFTTSEEEVPIDLSGYATTASVNALSSSINNTFNQYATTQSVTLLSQSISQSIFDISGSGVDLSTLADPSDPNNPAALLLQEVGLARWVQEGKDGQWYYNFEPNSSDPEDPFWNYLSWFNLAEWHDQEGGYQDNEWVVTGDLKDISEIIVSLKESGSLYQDEWGHWQIDAPSRNEFTSVSASFDQRINSITASGGGVDTVLREYLFGTGSLLTDGTIYPSASSNWVWEVSESRTFPLGAEIGEGKSIQVIVHNVGANEVEISFNDEYWGPYSVVNGALGSGSFTVKAGEYGDVVATQIDDRIYFRTSVDLSNIEVDLSGYATTASLNQVSESLSASIAVITASVNQMSASFDQRINNIVTGSGADLSVLADPSDPDNPVFLALASASFAEWDMDYHGGEWRINVPLQGELEGETTSFWDLTDVISPLERYLLEAGIWKVEFYYDEGQNTTHWTINTQESLSDTSWNENQVGKFLQSLGLADWEDFQDGGGQWYSKEPDYFTYTSASFDQRINAISSSDLSGYVTTASYNQDSASFDQRINSITASGGGADTVLREYLFGTGSLLTAGTIYPSASSNWVWEVSESRTFPLGAEIGEGKSIQVIVHNVGANEVEISFNDEYWGPYSVVNGALGSGSFTVKAGEYGDVVATQIGDKIYFRTSVDLSNIEVDLSGYATTSSVQAISSSLGNYLPLTGGTLSGDLKVQSANVSFGNESNLNTIDNAHNGLVAGEGNYLGAHWDECAIGRQNRAEDDFAIALGCNNKVGKLAQGMGVKTTASAQLSTAIGHGVTAKACGQVVIGSFNELDPSGSSSTTGSYAVILGNGLAENWSYNNPGNITRQNGLAIKWDGGIDINYSGSTITLQDKIAELEQGSSCLWLKGEVSYSVKLSPRSEIYGEYSVVEGDENNATGQCCHAEGWQNSASGQYSHVEGILNRASGQGAHAEGYNTTASGHQAHAEGRFTLAEGTATHAEGHRTTAVGYGTHAEGSNTRASQTSSHAEGYFTSASGWYSHAEGSGSKALGLASHAEGSNTTASADYSHAGGSGSSAQGSASYAGGWETVADYEYEHVIGRWNYQRAGLVSEEDKPLFAVGCGDDNIRKDAFEITRDGKHYIYGIGGYNGRNAQPGVNDVASVIANLVARIEALESGSNA